MPTANIVIQAFQNNAFQPNAFAVVAITKTSAEHIKLGYGKSRR